MPYLNFFSPASFMIPGIELCTKVACCLQSWKGPSTQSQDVFWEFLCFVLFFKSLTWLFQCFSGVENLLQRPSFWAIRGWMHQLFLYLGTGVQIYDRTSVLHVMVKKGQVTGVETDKGQIECQYFVNCAGQVG